MTYWEYSNVHHVTIGTFDMKTQQNMMPDFDVILTGATDIDARTKSLWLEIYRNACADRESSSMLLTDIMRALTGLDLTQHTLNGSIAAKYIERMEKANDQLLKLADLISTYREAQGELDSDELLDSISRSHLNEKA
jgi:hypothetical protein